MKLINLLTILLFGAALAMTVHFIRAGMGPDASTHDGAGDAELLAPTAVEEGPDFGRRHPAFAPALDQQPMPVAGASEVSTTGVGASVAKKNHDAVELLGEGEYEAAIALFEECRAAVPDEPIFARNLAEALARLATRLHGSEDPEEREEAYGYLERAVAADPDRTELARLLERWGKSREAEKDFWRKTTEHFEISFDGTREELMGRTTPLEDELESAYHEFGDLFGFFPVEHGRPRIRVVLYRRENFDSVTGLGDWAGGVFDGTVRVPVEDLKRELKRLKRVLRHELLHAFVQEAGGTRVPGWLNEGLAQWLEPAGGAGSRSAALDQARTRLRGKQLFTLERLGGSLATWSDEGEIGVAYAQSLAFVDFIARQYGERVLFDLVAGCKAQRSPEETFRGAIGIELSVALEDLVRAL